ncbi:uncharacterized protein LOC131624996 [Vicia villosa]|uniref:uncharacterized protein LOC131624996 n=1 Tax=Vicia villosa TaxID=3911 RepID=UPI00273B1261|nr:uncharacterized protein LOC131624996 [Vicia villosa]
MWVRKGVISIIDLSNEYFLVAFSHDDDKKLAMLNGPWFIYDHYLTFKDWRPNFQPDSDSIVEVAVWVRISGLPIEYYDLRSLTAFGNQIGSTIKVDKTTIKKERGKYARICVTVNLTKPLLAMFEINGSCYKFEYEGLHLLCLSCGRYGHYKEGCMHREKESNVVDDRNTMRMGDKDVRMNGEGSGAKYVDNGPWQIVQKPRRNKRAADGRKASSPANFNGSINGVGSRFLVLENEDGVINTITLENNVETEKVSEDVGVAQIMHGNNIATNNSRREKVNMGKEKVTYGGPIFNLSPYLTNSVNDLAIHGDTIKEHINSKKGGTIMGSGRRRHHVVPQENKKFHIAARGGVAVKENASSISKKGLEDIFGQSASSDQTRMEKANIFTIEKPPDPPSVDGTGSQAIDAAMNLMTDCSVGTVVGKDINYEYSVEDAASSAFFRICKQYVDSHKPSMIVIVETRHLLWEELINLAANINEPWMLAGDFNDLADPSDKKGGAPISVRRCKNFLNRVNMCKLNELVSHGPKFTWKGPVYHGGQDIYEKLDRVMSNDLWRLNFPDVFVKVLVRVAFSDHHPVLINLKEDYVCPRIHDFKFESAWMMHETYQDMLKGCWQKDDNLNQNLSNIVNGIKQWKFETFDQVHRGKRSVTNRLNGVQRSLQINDNSGGMKALEIKLQNELSRILNQEELMWFQRSRTMWLADGDRNTRYYHMKAINHRKRNRILMLKDDNDSWIEDSSQLQQHATNFYMNLFSSPNRWSNWMQTDISFPKLEHFELKLLNVPICAEEVYKALFSMKPWKAPGPDGFPAGFYQKAYDELSKKCHWYWQRCL